MASPVQEKAEKYYRQAIESMRTQRYGDAEQKLKKALKANPSHERSYIAYGDIAMESGRAAIAIKNYAQALKLNSQNAKVWRNLGSIQLTMLCDYNTAVASLTQAIQLDPSDAQTYYFLGRASYSMRNYNDAAALYEAGLQISPLHDQMIASLGMCYLTLRQFDKAKEYIYRAFQMSPRDYGIFTTILQASRSLQFTPQQLMEINNVAEELQNEPKFKDKIALHKSFLLQKNNDLDALEDLLTSIETSDPEIFILKNYLLGDALHKLKRYDDAFKSYQQANKVQLKSNTSQSFSLDSVYKLFQETYTHIKKESVPQFIECIQSTPKAPYKTPYFLIGFPRSGTTLTGQILNQHPSLHTLDEYSALDQIKLHIAQQLGMSLPQDFKKITSEQLSMIHALYNELQAQELSQNPDKHIIDKMPFNTAHIASAVQLFPDTKFIYVQRHPLDCVLSCYMQNFELNSAMVHFLDITSAAKLYKAHHELWSYYKDTLPFDYTEIRYENLIQDFDQETEKATKLLGINWVESMRDFHESQGNKSGPNSLTPSRNQVNKQLYTHASGRWKNYQDHLEPAIKILEPIIKDLDYEL